MLNRLKKSYKLVKINFNNRYRLIKIYNRLLNNNKFNNNKKLILSLLNFQNFKTILKTKIIKYLN